MKFKKKEKSLKSAYHLKKKVLVLDIYIFNI